jgi:hypothetical protein
MSELFKKLNFKDQKAVLIINIPKSVEPILDEIIGKTLIVKDVNEVTEIDFAMCFVTGKDEMETLMHQIYPKLVGDSILWLCYPKMSSKKYKCDFNRDTGWAIMAEFNLEPVRMVAIDEDFSALRFRKVEYIKKITRRESFAITTEAKSRTTQKGK